MKLARLMGIGLAVASLAACSAVIVEEPIGAEIVQIEADDWEGIWVAADGEILTVSVGDRDAGMLWISSIDGDDENRPTLESRAVYVRAAPHLGSRKMLLSVEDDGGYVWGLVVRDEEYALFYAPDTAKFRDLVEAGVLPGKASVSTIATAGKWSEDNGYLGRLEAEHLEAIFGDEYGNLFEWDRPLVLRRVAQ